MAMKLKEIAALVGGEVVGDPEIVIERVAPIQDAQPGDITFVSNPKYAPHAETTKASAIIVSPKLKDLGRALIVVKNPYLANARLVGALMEDHPPRVPGIHPSAVVADSARIGEDAVIGPHVVIEDEVELGDGVTIMAGVALARGVSIGDETIIHPNTTLYRRVKIGKRCIIHANVTLGSSGFGFAPNGHHYERIPQVGNTIVGDDVSIGANSVINRGALNDTIIGSGTKIDSLVIISHNVTVGEDCLFVSQVGISGTVKIGKHATFGGQVGVAGHLEIGDNVMVAAQSGVSGNLAANGAYFGSPARPMSETKRTYAALHRLPELRKEIRRVQKHMSELTARLARDVSDMTTGTTDEKVSVRDL